MGRAPRSVDSPIRAVAMTWRTRNHVRAGPPFPSAGLVSMVAKPRWEMLKTLVAVAGFKSEPRPASSEPREHADWVASNFQMVTTLGLWRQLII